MFELLEGLQGVAESCLRPRTDYASAYIGLADVQEGYREVFYGEIDVRDRRVHSATRGFFIAEPTTLFVQSVSTGQIQHFKSRETRGDNTKQLCVDARQEGQSELSDSGRQVHEEQFGTVSLRRQAVRKEVNLDDL